MKRIWENFQNYWAFQHLKDFKEDMDPIIKYCKSNVYECAQMCKENYKIIGRFDEIIWEKASKFAIDDIKKGINKY